MTEPERLPPAADEEPRLRRLLGLLPAALAWAALVGWLAYALYARTGRWREAAAANLRAWLHEARNFRKPLPELVRDLLALRDQSGPEASGDAERNFKAEEIAEQLKALAEPTRRYQYQLPLFPEIYRLEVRFTDPDLPP